MFPHAELGVPARPDQTNDAGLDVMRHEAHRTREGIAVPVHGADRLPAWLVDNRVSQLGHECRQRRRRNMAIRPEPTMNLGLRDNPRPALEQQLEQRERLGREMNRCRAPGERRASRSRTQSPNCRRAGSLMARDALEDTPAERPSVENPTSSQEFQ
jgi:hypothetical protein